MLELLVKLHLQVAQEVLAQHVINLAVVPVAALVTYVVQIKVLPVHEHVSLRCGCKRCAQTSRVRPWTLQVTLCAVQYDIKLRLQTFFDGLAGCK